MKTLLLVLAAGLLALVIAAALGLRSLAARSAESPPRHLADRDLSHDPGTPNFVSSLVVDPERRIEPLRFEGDPEEAWERAAEVVTAMEKTKVVSRDSHYLHAEIRTPLFGFVDDIELLRNPGESVIHIRSGSRVGHSDLGTNRKRVEAIRERFEQAFSRMPARVTPAGTASSADSVGP